MNKKVLGKGLAALIPEKETHTPEKSSNILSEHKEYIHKEEKIAYLKTSIIKPNPYQPRENFDFKRLNELVSSIKEKGVVQPILVRRHGEEYELIAGERRLRAVKSLGMDRIPAIIKKAKDLDSLEISLIENVQRENLNPIEEAHAYQRLIDEFNFDQDGIAEAVGKDRTTVSNMLRLLKLPQKVQDALQKGQLTMGHGRALLGIENVSKQMEICKKIIAKGLSVREVENLVREKRFLHLKKKPTAPKEQDHHLNTIEEELQHILGTKVRIIKGKKRGRLEVEYYSNADLERIINIIKNTN